MTAKMSCSHRAFLHPGISVQKGGKQVQTGLWYSKTIKNKWRRISMKKKIFATVLASVMVMGLAAGCG